MRNIEKLTIIKDFYTFVDEDGRNRYDVEKFLGSSIEAKYNVLVDLINKGVEVDIIKNQLSFYVAAQYMRTPKAKSKLHREIENVCRGGDSGKIFEAEDMAIFTKNCTLYGKPITYQEFLEKRNEMDVNVDIDKGVHAKYMIHRLQGMAEDISKRKWLILKAPKHENFITCDNPIVSVQKYKDLKLTALDGEIFILSDKLAVAIGDNWDGYYDIFSDDMEYINHSIALNSDRYLFSSDEKLLRENVKLLNKESLYS